MFYEVVLSSDRFFNSQTLYREVDWSSLDGVVDAFVKRIEDWYIGPVQWLERHNDPGHFAFTVMAVNCLLIDALSQFVYGELHSRGELFKRFIRDHLPLEYSKRLATAVIHFDHKFSLAGSNLRTMDDLIWNGFRCGILHQAHAPLYCGIVPGRDAIEEHAAGYAKYEMSHGHAPTVVDCPTVVIRPFKLFDDIQKAFKDYIAKLKDRDLSNNDLRVKFKTKFSDSFGKDIMTLT